MIKVFGYSEQNNKYGGSGYIRYVGHCHKVEFIDTVNGGFTRGASWIRDRMGESGNDDEIRLAMSRPGRVVVYDYLDRDKRVLTELKIRRSG